MKRLYSLQRGAFSPTKLCFCGTVLGEVGEFFFDPPAEDVVGSLLNERKANEWRSQLREVSGASWSDPENAPMISDDGERQMHNVLVSNSFALHPMFGTGHVLRTDGRIAAFWNGERTYIVHLTNLKMLRVVISQDKERSDRPQAAPKKPSKREASIQLAIDMLFS